MDWLVKSIKMATLIFEECNKKIKKKEIKINEKEILQTKNKKEPQLLKSTTLSFSET